MTALNERAFELALKTFHYFEGSIEDAVLAAILAYHASEPDAVAVERGVDINAPGMRETIAAAIANARVMRRGVPTISNILDILPEKLRNEVLDDAENVQTEVATSIRSRGNQA